MKNKTKIMWLALIAFFVFLFIGGAPSYWIARYRYSRISESQLNDLCGQLDGAAAVGYVKGCGFFSDKRYWSKRTSGHQYIAVNISGEYGVIVVRRDWVFNVSSVVKNNIINIKNIGVYDTYLYRRGAFNDGSPSP